MSRCRPGGLVDQIRRLVLFTIVVAAGCSPHPEPTAAASVSGPSPAASRSLLGSTAVAPGGISGKFDVSFPARNESFDFRNQLEAKYQTGLGRAAAPTFVDAEGEVVWTGEYMRYRVNGCDHAGAVQRVLAQVDGQAAGQSCGPAAEGLITFPPRSDALDFRRQLESKYQQSGRGLSESAVDPEGGVIWTQEYLRYRVNQCDHPTSIQKVFTQVDGGAVPATCSPCIFTVSPSANHVTASGGTFTATIKKTSGEADCAFTVETLAPYVTLVSGTSGAATTTLTYTVRPNFANARSTAIRVRWPNNSALLDIDQDAGNTASFTMTDPFNAPGVATSICMIRSTATPCAFSATGNFSANATYAWAIRYDRGAGTVVRDFIGGPTFTFTESCGGPVATASGTEVPMSVIVVVTDGASRVTLQSGQGGQAVTLIKFFTCQ